MKRGIATKRLEVQELLEARLFPSPVRLPTDPCEMYDERVPTRQVTKPRQHELL